MYKKILLALDMSSEAEHLMMKAKELSQLFNARVDVINVVEPVVVETTFDLTPVVDADLDANLVKRAKGFISHMQSHVGITIDEILVPVGSTRHEIHEAAKSLSSDLIIIGSHGRHGIGLLLGSTANSVLHGAPCDVLSVKIILD